MGWQGGRHLAESALWTWEFCTALLHCWQMLPEIVRIMAQDVSSDSSEEEEAFPGQALAPDVLVVQVDSSEEELEHEENSPVAESAVDHQMVAA